MQKLPQYARHADPSRLVRLFCKGDSPHMAWAELNCEHPGKEVLARAQAHQFKATCLRCGTIAAVPYNWDCASKRTKNATAQPIAKRRIRSPRTPKRTLPCARRLSSSSLPLPVFGWADDPSVWLLAIKVCRRKFVDGFFMQSKVSLVVSSFIHLYRSNLNVQLRESAIFKHLPTNKQQRNGHRRGGEALP